MLKKKISRRKLKLSDGARPTLSRIFKTNVKCTARKITEELNERLENLVFAKTIR